MVRRAIRHLGFYFDGHCRRSPDQAGEVSDDFIGNSTGIAAHTGRVENCRAVEAFRLYCRWLEAT